VPEAIRSVGSLLTDGWPAVMERNRRLALAARKTICEALHIAEPCPEKFIGSLAAIPLLDSTTNAGPQSPFGEHPLHDKLREKYKIEVPVISWPAPPKRVLRISAQLYNTLPQYELLAKALVQEFGGAVK